MSKKSRPQLFYRYTADVSVGIPIKTHFTKIESVWMPKWLLKEKIARYTNDPNRLVKNIKIYQITIPADWDGTEVDFEL